MAYRFLDAAIVAADHADDNDRLIMGQQVNSTAMNILGYVTTAAIFAASAGFTANWFM